MSHPRVRVGITVPAGPPVGLLRLQVGLARMARLDSLLMPDHLQSPLPDALWREVVWLRDSSPHSMFDYASALGWVAARAGNLRLGVAVTDPIRRHPVVVAQTMLTLANLTRRAPILGIGSGERENLGPYGLPRDHPTARLEESLQILRACFSGTLGDFSGRYYTLDRAIMGLGTPPGRTPEIWIGAHGPRMLELTGRFGDGWIPTVALTPEDYADRWEQVRNAAVTAGRSPERITASLACYLLIGRDETEVRALRRSSLARYLALMTPASVWRAAGADHPLGPQFRGFVDIVPETMELAQLRAAMGSVPEQLGAIGAMVGTPDQVVTRVRALAEAGLRHFTPLLLSGALSRRNALQDTRLFPLLARRLQGGR